jgi:hypothetical protein
MRTKMMSLAVVTVTALTPAAPAYAAGCLKGAAIGGVTGHFAGHHAFVGAVVGCAVGRHLAAKQRRQEELRRQQQVGTAPHGSQGDY